MEERRTILITDDDEATRGLIRFVLEHEGYKVLQAANGLECLELVKGRCPDLIVLDVVMPEMDGLETCRRIRDFSQVPILMLTAKSQSNDIVTGLDSGADDYLLKPFEVDELLARIRALFRRFPRSSLPIRVGGGTIQIDRRKREVIVGERVVELTPTEYLLLLTLAENAGSVMEHDRIRRAVWGNDDSKDNEHLKVYIWHLRRKIEEDPHNPKCILTEWGVGYRLVA